MTRTAGTTSPPCRRFGGEASRRTSGPAQGQEVDPHTGGFWRQLRLSYSRENFEFGLAGGHV